jgi:hypothetical protein
MRIGSLILLLISQRCSCLRLERVVPGDYLLGRSLALVAMNAFYGNHRWVQGPLAYAQRSIIEADVLTDLSARLRYYEEARDRELPHTGAVFLARDDQTDAICGFADVGLTLFDPRVKTFALPKRCV